MTIPNIALNDGKQIPQLGYGVFKVAPEETERMVSEALAAGYRHIDTASLYGNEEGVGRAIAASGIDRSELYITTKMWNDSRGEQQTRDAMAVSLEKLGLDYVDLYLIHWPAPKNGPIKETWETFAKLREEGLATSIGVANFDDRYLPELLETGILPAVNQIELHPQFQQRTTTLLSEKNDIRIEAWGPLGQAKVDYAGGQIGEIAAAHGISWAQTVLAWHLQKGHIVFPKSSSRERMDENMASVNVQLTAEQLAAIDGYDKGIEGRVSGDPAEVN